MEAQQTLPAEPESVGRHAQWIAGRIKTLLSHYYQPDTPQEVEEAAMDDWIEILLPFRQRDIERACSGYLRDQPRRRPSPGEIRARAASGGEQTSKGMRENLSYDELKLLDEKVLPTARRWLNTPGMQEQGRATLDFWGGEH